MTKYTDKQIIDALKKRYHHVDADFDWYYLILLFKRRYNQPDDWSKQISGIIEQEKIKNFLNGN